MAMRNRFDGQAEQFDLRAGLPEMACRTVAKAVVNTAEDSAQGLLLEVGAGTGQIGQFLLGSRFPYVGCDVSSEMLGVFRRRLAPQTKLELIEADANERWPVPDASTAIVFSSRTLHLLKTEHVVREVFRIIKRGVLVVGRVRRDSESVKAEMRREMRQLLQESGFQARSGEQTRQDLLDRCCARGAVPLEPVDAATWQCEPTPLQSIVSWEEKQGLDGLEVAAEVKQAVLERLRSWAVKRYGDLERPSRMCETYVLEGVRFTPLS